MKNLSILASLFAIALLAISCNNSLPELPDFTDVTFCRYTDVDGKEKCDNSYIVSAADCDSIGGHSVQTCYEGAPSSSFCRYTDGDGPKCEDVGNDDLCIFALQGEVVSSCSSTPANNYCLYPSNDGIVCEQVGNAELCTMILQGTPVQSCN